jgi:hypothetical protein
VAQAEYAVRELKKIRGLDISLAPYEKSRRVQRIVVQWDEHKLGITGDECERQLLAGASNCPSPQQAQGLVFVFFWAILATRSMSSAA